MPRRCDEASIDVAIGSRGVAPEANRPRRPRHHAHHDVDGRAFERHRGADPARTLERIELDDATIVAVVASLGSGPRPVTLDKARIDRQIRDLALEHAAGRLEDEVYLERLREFRDAKDNLERTSADGITAERAVAWLRALSATWRAAEVPAEKADLLHAIYDRITVAGTRSSQ